MVLTSGCTDSEIDLKPEIKLITTPGLSGLTTDNFVFDARQTINPPGGGKLFFRWNFGEDSAWDSQLSKDPLKTIRFWKPGNYLVTVYAINSKGFSDTTFCDINISLGRSAPRPVIRIEPATGHFLTPFRFDAQLTRDDEDSLNTLLFKWDYNGDGIWDTDFDTLTVSTYVFGMEGNFKPIVEVIDPTGLRALAYTKVTVTSVDPDIIADFSWTPADGTLVDTILFDASESHHLTNSSSRFNYSWRLEEGEGWTLPADTPTIRYKFRTIRDQQILLKVTDERGLFNTIGKPIHLDPENFPPTATFDVSVPYGNIRTQFRLSAWNCKDDQDTTGNLLVRWDFDGDKIWDTGFSTEKLLFHQYNTAGHFNLTIEVMDSKGLTSQYSRKVLVSPWENETGILRDSRDGQYYGTVKIGDHWWMAENLKYDFRSDLAPSKIMFPSIALNEDPSTIETYGRYYYVKDAIVNRVAPDEVDYVHPLCPRSWRIPTKHDWEQLIADTHSDMEPGNLVLGGKSDFNATYMGYVDFTIIWLTMNVPKDTIYNFRDTFKKTWFFSANQHSNIDRVDLFIVQIDRNGPTLWTGWERLSLYIPVRCVKEE